MPAIEELQQHPLNNERVNAYAVRVMLPKGKKVPASLAAKDGESTFTRVLKDGRTMLKRGLLGAELLQAAIDGELAGCTVLTAEEADAVLRAEQEEAREQGFAEGMRA